MHNQTKDVPDIRDWIKPYIQKTIDKLMKYEKDEDWKMNQPGYILDE